MRVQASAQAGDSTGARRRVCTLLLGCDRQNTALASLPSSLTVSGTSSGPDAAGGLLPLRFIAACHTNISGTETGRMPTVVHGSTKSSSGAAESRGGGGGLRRALLAPGSRPNTGLVFLTHSALKHIKIFCGTDELYLDIGLCCRWWNHRLIQDQTETLALLYAAQSYLENIEDVILDSQRWDALAEAAVMQWERQRFPGDFRFAQRTVV